MHALICLACLFLFANLQERPTCDTRRCCTSLMCSSMLVTIDSTRFTTNLHSSVQVVYQSFLKLKSTISSNRQCCLMWGPLPTRLQHTTHTYHGPKQYLNISPKCILTINHPAKIECYPQANIITWFWRNVNSMFISYRPDVFHNLAFLMH